MDPATIAAAAITILSPYVKDAGRELVKTVGEVSLEKTKGMLAWLKEKFSDDPAAAKDLSRFESDPKTFEPSLHATIVEKAQADPEFATELQKRVDDVGADIKIFQKFRVGTNIIAVDSDTMPTGTLDIHQEGDEVTNMTGVRAKPGK